MHYYSEIRSTQVFYVRLTFVNPSGDHIFLNSEYSVGLVTLPTYLTITYHISPSGNSFYYLDNLIHLLEFGR